MTEVAHLAESVRMLADAQRDLAERTQRAIDRLEDAAQKRDDREQVVHDRILAALAEVRDAVRARPAGDPEAAAAGGEALVLSRRGAMVPWRTAARWVLPALAAAVGWLAHWLQAAIGGGAP